MVSPFAMFHIDIVTIASIDNSVLLEQELLVWLAEGGPQQLLRFAAFVVEDSQVTAWQQLHG
jgi:limonene-1,2-epoxide hydrolase